MSVLKTKDGGGNWTSVPSIKGDTGDAAGFGTVVASVDANHGTPSVTVTTSGDDTAKNFDFAFHNLQPAPYDDSELQQDFATLQAQFDTAVSAVTTDTEVTDIRVGADGITDTTAGASVRRQFTDLKSDLSGVCVETGIMATAGAYTVNDVLFTISDFPADTIMNYSISAESGKIGYIGIYDSNDTLITFVGKNYEASGALNYDGNYTLPSNYSYAKVITSVGANLTIHFLIAENSNNMLYEKVLEVSEPYTDMVDWSNLNIGKNWTGGSASDRATLIIAVDNSAPYFFRVPTATKWTSIAVVEIQTTATPISSLKSTTINTNTETVLTTTANTHYIIVQFNGTSALSASDFSNYDLYICKGTKAVLTAKDDIARNDANSHSAQIVKLQAQAEKSAVYKISDTPETVTSGAGYYTKTGTIAFDSVTGMNHYDLVVSSGEKYQIYGYFPDQTNNLVEYIFFNANNQVVSYKQLVSGGLMTDTVTVPSTAVKMGINSYGIYTAVCNKYIQDYTEEYIARQVSYWKDKKIVWFGTSIPAGGVNAGDSGYTGAYPNRIGQMLGATVYNEAVGASCARAGSYHSISANDPMGWGGMETANVLLSFSLSSSEKQDIIDNWDGKWKNILINPQQYDPTKISLYLNSSWDNKLTKYLSDGAVGQCDLYVFDHGYNDAIPTYGFTDLDVEPTTNDDRTYWFGAMNFLIGKILADNPLAKILIVGHYNYGDDAFNRGDNFKGSLCCEAQKKYATKWGTTCVKTWELLGLSMNLIDVNGVDTPVIYARYPDHLHPVSDTSGYELQRYAEALAPYVNMARGV